MIRLAPPLSPPCQFHLANQLRTGHQLGRREAAAVLAEEGVAAWGSMEVWALQGAHSQREL